MALIRLTLKSTDTAAIKAGPAFVNNRDFRQEDENVTVIKLIYIIDALHVLLILFELTKNTFASKNQKNNQKKFQLKKKSRKKKSREIMVC